jgi:hypothetical protein
MRAFSIALFLEWIRVMATTLRALVMLGVLVGGPAAWIYYGPLPPEAQRTVDRLVGAAKQAISWGQRPATSHELTGSVRKDSETSAPAWNGAAANSVSTVTNPSQGPAEPLAAPPLVAAQATTFEQRLEPLLLQLRELGVAEYALERWGDGGSLYRFHCEMPLTASAQLTQQFEAVAGDPQQSVEQVVAQVSEWQLAQRRGGM